MDKERYIEMEATLKLLERKFEALLTILEEEGVVRKDKIQEKLDEQ